ncbi:MAG: YkoP family protein [Steroidobacteraceae bacterium]
MSVELSEKRGSGLAWLEHAIFALDGWLRRRQGIFEYSADPRCLFRVELGRADQTLRLHDGTSVRTGDQVLVLHLWNENIPAMGQEGPTVAWAHQVSRAIHASLRELARYLEQQPRLAPVRAVCGDMQLGSARQTEQLAHIVERYGFEALDDWMGRHGAVHRIGKSLLIFLLVAATNPIALRSAILRRYHKRVFLSRATLERRYRR